MHGAAENTGILITLFLAPKVVVLSQARTQGSAPSKPIAQQLEQGYHSERSLLLSPTECWLKMCPERENRPKNIKVPNFFPKKLTSFARVKNFKPKGILKNSGSCL